jgi:hypothetical protein
LSATAVSKLIVSASLEVHAVSMPTHLTQGLSQNLVRSVYSIQTSMGCATWCFPVTMATYNYSEAPELLGDDFPADPADSVASFDTSDEHVLRF